MNEGDGLEFECWCLTPLSAIFHYIMVTSLVVEEAGIPGENN
jgi:hypothetical protein